MGRKVSVIVLSMVITLSSTACTGDNPAYSELSRDQTAADRLPAQFLRSVTSGSDFKLVEESSRLVGTQAEFAFYLILNARLIVKRNHRPSAARPAERSRNRSGVCTVIVSRANDEFAGMGCSEGGPNGLGVGSAEVRYVPPRHGNDSGPDVPRGWVKISDNLILSD